MSESKISKAVSVLGCLGFSFFVFSVSFSFLSFFIFLFPITGDHSPQLP